MKVKIGTERIDSRGIPLWNDYKTIENVVLVTIGTTKDGIGVDIETDKKIIEFAMDSIILIRHTNEQVNIKCNNIHDWNEYLVSIVEECNMLKIPGDFFETLARKIRIPSNNPGGCDHTHKYTIETIEEYKLDKKEVLKMFMRHGGYCDCEVLFNVYANMINEVKETF